MNTVGQGVMNRAFFSKREARLGDNAEAQRLLNAQPTADGVDRRVVVGVPLS